MTIFKRPVGNRTYVAALPILLLAACGDDLESRNAALGLEEDGTSDIVLTRQTSSRGGNTRQIDGLGEVDQVAGDFADMDGPEAGPDADSDEDSDGEPTIVDASPEDLRDTAQGFAAEPIDSATGIDPSPILPDPVGD